jgi:hypothetical protein
MMKALARTAVYITVCSTLAISVIGCSSIGTKAATRKVKMATPGVDAKGEKATKRVKAQSR